MSRRYSTASTGQASAAVDLLRSQGYDAHSDVADEAVVVLDRESVEAVELLLRRAPAARTVE